MYPTLVTPPGITFSIWGVIYAGLAIVILIGIFRKSSDSADILGPWFLISCAFNIGWIFAWHYQSILLSHIAITGLLVSLYKIYTRTRSAKMLTKATFSVYYSWITVAWIVSAFVLVKTLSGGAPVTPIEPRSAFSLEERNDIDKALQNLSANEYDRVPISIQPEDDGSVSLDPPERTLPDIYDDIMLISETGQEEPLIIVGGDPEIVSHVTGVEYVFAAVALLIAGALSVIHIIAFDDFFYAAVTLWALGGIAYRQLTAVTTARWVLVAAIVSMLAVTAAVISKLIRFPYECNSCDDIERNK